MRLVQNQIDNIRTAAHTLCSRITEIEGLHHGEAWVFNQCMRAFDVDGLAPTAVTFSVFLNVPIMARGEATISRDGALTMRTI